MLQGTKLLAADNVLLWLLVGYQLLLRAAIYDLGLLSAVYDLLLLWWLLVDHRLNSLWYYAASRSRLVGDS